MGKIDSKGKFLREILLDEVTITAHTQVLEMDETKSRNDDIEKVYGNTISKSAKDKKLRKIKYQMEFYFSDANLQRDGLLRRLTEENDDGSVDLNIFMTFNRIQVLTNNLEDVKKAITYSNALKLVNNKTRVCRNTKFVPMSEKDVEERTLYVERIPAHVDDTFVRHIFKKFGPIRYVALPRFRKTHKLKGFAFVEFELVESVQKACEFYKVQEQEEKENEQNEEVKKPEGRKRKSSESNNQQRAIKKRRRSESEKTPEKESRKIDFNTRSGISRTHHKHEKHSGKKRKRTSSENEKAPKSAKTSSVSTDLIKEHAVKKELDSSADEGNDSSLALQNEKPTVKEELGSSVQEETVVTVKNEGPTLKCETGNLIMETTTEMGPDGIGNSEKYAEVEVKHDSNEDIGAKVAIDEDGPKTDDHEKKKRKRHKKSDGKLKFRVMPKSEWKAYRNTYLNLQRKALSHIKKILMLENQQKKDCNAMLSSCASDTVTDTGNSVEKKGSDIEFQPNIIVKVLLIESPASVHSLITDVRSCGEIAFVDASDPKEIFVRFRSPEAAKKCLEDGKLDYLGTCEIITGEAESLYWEKVQKDREAQRNRQRSKKRGREKILERAEKMAKNTHIHFEDV